MLRIYFKTVQWPAVQVKPVIKKLTGKKNRYKIPTASQFDSSISLADLLQPGIDTSRFDDTKAIIITGWVFNVITKGSLESCNCNHKGPDSQDVHIEIALKKNTKSMKKIFIAEITPRLRTMIFQQLGISETNPKLKNRLLKKNV